MTAGSMCNPTVMLRKADKHFFIFMHGLFSGYRKGARTLFIPDDYPEPSASLSFADKIIYPMDQKRNKLSFPEYAQNYFLTSAGSHGGIMPVDPKHPGPVTIRGALEKRKEEEERKSNVYGSGPTLHGCHSGPGMLSSFVWLHYNGKPRFCE